jgi:hypothetical protein
MTLEPQNQQRFAAAIRRFDEENSADPRKANLEGREEPYELAFARLLTEWVLRLAPDAPEELRLAARCQHLCRWQIPREKYPMTRAGYLRWREELKRFHAARAGEILREAGYPEEFVRRVQDLNLKRNFPQDPQSRVLEDALCLVFLERQLAELSAKSSEEKVLNALRKSWAKMTPKAQSLALKLNYGAREQKLIEKALGLGQANESGD